MAHGAMAHGARDAPKPEDEIAELELILLLVNSNLALPRLTFEDDVPDIEEDGDLAYLASSPEANLALLESSEEIFAALLCVFKELESIASAFRKVARARDFAAFDRLKPKSDHQDRIFEILVGRLRRQERKELKIRAEALFQMQRNTAHEVTAVTLLRIEELRAASSPRSYRLTKTSHPYTWDMVKSHRSQMFYGMFRMWPKHVESFFTKLTEGANIRDLFKRNKEAGVGRGFCEPICILACLILYCAGRDCHVISLVMNISTSCAIRNVAEARDIVCNRRHLFVPDGISAFDTVEKRSKLAEGFNRLTFGAARGIKTMQNCIGAFDGMLLEVDRQIVVPNDRGMRNHKTTKSPVNVQACVDARRRFTMFHVDSSGSTNDALAFSLSPLGRWLQESRPDLGDFWFIGDGGYALDDHVMIPYRQYSCHAGVTADQARGFNIKASSLRSPVECAFGIFKDKWRVFRTPLHFGCPGDRINLMYAAAALHNHCIDERVWSDGVEILARTRNRLTGTFNDDTTPAHVHTNSVSGSPTRDRASKTGQARRQQLTLQLAQHYQISLSVSGTRRREQQVIEDRTSKRRRLSSGARDS